jgi:hypothetical protein
MPPWLQALIDQLNQEPEPDDIIQAEIRFIRLSRIDAWERHAAFEEAYRDTIQRVLDVAARLYPLRHGGGTVPPGEVARWRGEIETGFYDDLRTMEAAWAEEFGWIERLVNLVGFDPFTPHWRTLLSNTFRGFRRALRRLIEEYADLWVRVQLSL